MRKSAYRACCGWALSCFLFGSAASSAAAAQAQSIAFTGATVLPMDGTPDLSNATVLVRDGRITDVGPGARVRVPDGAQVIDARGKFLIPGLIDAHAHLTHQQSRNQEQRALALYALRGVTTIRVMWGDTSYPVLAARVRNGELLGPDLVLAGPAFLPNSTPEAARTTVAAQKQAGYDLVKLLAPSAALFDSVVSAARAAGIPLSGHVPPAVGIVRAARAFVSLEHLDGLFEALQPSTSGASGFFGLNIALSADTTRIRSLVQQLRSSGTTIVPTEAGMELFVDTSALESLLLRPEMAYVPASVRAVWQNARRNFGAQINPVAAAAFQQVRRQFLREAAGAGVPIVAGSDAWNTFAVPGFALAHELEVLALAGLSNVQALRSATAQAAQLLGRADRGTITKGKRADLVLLSADPRRDIRAAQSVSGVLLQGRWLPSAEIDARLAALRDG